MYLQYLKHKQDIAGHQHYTWVAVAVGYLDLAEVVQLTVFAFEVQDLQVVALKKTVELEGIIMEHQYFGWAIVEIPSIGS